MTIATNVGPEGRAKRLRAASTAMHERVDNAVMAAAPFASREHYARFLRFQSRLHRRVEALYADPDLQPLLPDLAGRSRLTEVERDLADLGLALPDADEAAPRLPLPEALGWVYVVEGSNVGAAILVLPMCSTSSGKSWMRADQSHRWLRHRQAGSGRSRHLLSVEV